MAEHIDIRLDTGETRPYEVGRLSVPEDHDAPARGELTLSYYRLRSPHPDRTPVVFLSGGPGDPVDMWLRHTPFRRVFERVAETRDVVLLDQRGCGRSEGETRCEPPGFRPGWLADPDTAFAMLTDQATRTREALGSQLVPTWYTPWQSARDLGCVADALGVERVHLWGYSYGTHLAQAVLKVSPERVERAVLCGFEGPDQTYKLPSRIQAQLIRLSELFARQGLTDDFLGLMARVHEALDTAPVEVRLADGSPTAVGRFGLQWLVGSWIGVSNRFTRLPELYLSLERGETGALEKVVPGFAKMLARRPATFYLKDAASGATPGRLVRIARERDGCFLGDAANFPFPRIREPWGQIDLGDGFRRPLVSAHPLFILTGSLDGFTPPENARKHLATLPNARLSVIENAAHNDLLSCPEAVEDVIRFFHGEPVERAAYRVHASG